MSKYATPGSAGLDLESAVNISIKPGERALVQTTLNGPILDNNNSVYWMVVPRSGLALKHGVTVLNAPGIIDMDYTGNIGVILYNTDKDEVFEVKEGDRIAQLLSVQMMRLTKFEVGNGERGDGGYGSTGR